MYKSSTVNWWLSGEWPSLIMRFTHWSRVTHICVSRSTIVGCDNGLSPGRSQVIIWTNAGILLIGPLETKFSEILIKMYKISFRKMHLKISSRKWRPFCLGLLPWNLLIKYIGNSSLCKCLNIFWVRHYLHLVFFLRILWLKKVPGPCCLKVVKIRSFNTYFL